MFNTVMTEITNLWFYAYSMIAGASVSFIVVVFFLVLAHLKIARLENEIRRTHNQMVVESRDASLRLNKLEKK